MIASNVKVSSECIKFSSIDFLPYYDPMIAPILEGGTEISGRPPGGGVHIVIPQAKFSRIVKINSSRTNSS